MVVNSPFPLGETIAKNFWQYRLLNRHWANGRRRFLVKILAVTHNGVTNLGNGCRLQLAQRVTDPSCRETHLVISMTDTEHGAQGTMVLGKIV